MGWFRDAIGAIGSKIGEGLEYIGEKTGIGVLEDIGIDIQVACMDTSEDVGKTKEYDKESSGIHDTMLINEILSKFSFNLKEKADRIEEKCLSEVELYYDNLIDQLSANKRDINITNSIKGLKSSLKLMKRDIKGSIKNHLAKRVSIDDYECLQILQMPSGMEKERKMENYGNKVIKEALDDLIYIISEVVDEQNEKIKEYFEDILEMKSIKVNSMQKQLKEILNQRNDTVSEKEVKLLTPKLLIELSEEVLNQMYKIA